MKAKKLLTAVLAIVMIFAVAVPASAVEPEITQATTESVARWVPASVPDYYLTVEYYDGGRYTTPTYYKELRLPSATSTYTQSGPSIKSMVYDTYYNNVKVKKVTRWEWSYVIYP